MDQTNDTLTRLLVHDVHQHFRQVVITYQHHLYTFALRLTGSPQDAEDIVQEAFVKAYATLLNYPPLRIQTLKLRPWLYKITLNMFRHHVRSRVQILPLDLSEESQHLNIEDTEREQPEQIFEEQETWLEIEYLVAQLPERYRVAIICYYFEHLTYQQIAEQFDQPQGTVKSTISRGVRLLRSSLTHRAAGKENLS